MTAPPVQVTTDPVAGVIMIVADELNGGAAVVALAPDEAATLGVQLIMASADVELSGWPGHD